LCMGIPGCSQESAASSLDALLARTGQRVELFWQQIGSYTCTESVTREKIGKKDRIEFKTVSVFDYLALAKPMDDALVAEELRLPQKKERVKPSHTPLLSTNGFPTLLLIFHPKYQHNFRYRAETENIKGDQLVPVRFEHISGTSSTCALALRDRIYTLDLKGIAWIDAATGVIHKIAAGLTSPMADINIQAFDIEVEYQPRTFPSDPIAKWLPSIVEIDVRTKLQHWRNTHLFSQYKIFSVQSTESRQH
jgi:hypothetical protein